MTSVPAVVSTRCATAQRTPLRASKNVGNRPRWSRWSGTRGGDVAIERVEHFGSARIRGAALAQQPRDVADMGRDARARIVVLGRHAAERRDEALVADHRVDRLIGCGFIPT